MLTMTRSACRLARLILSTHGLCFAHPAEDLPHLRLPVHLAGVAGVGLHRLHLADVGVNGQNVATERVVNKVNSVLDTFLAATAAVRMWGASALTMPWD